MELTIHQVDEYAKDFRDQMDIRSNASGNDRKRSNFLNNMKKYFKNPENYNVSFDLFKLCISKDRKIKTLTEERKQLRIENRKLKAELDALKEKHQYDFIVDSDED